MSIQNLILGSLVSRGADRLLNPNRKNVVDINKFISGGGIGGEEKDKGPRTFGGVAKQGIMSLIAQAVLGPLLGPLALNLGQRFVNQKKLGLGFFEKPGDPTQLDDSRGTFTAEGMQFAEVQDTLGSTDSGTDIDYNTGDVTDITTGANIGNVYDEVPLTGGDSSNDDGSNGGGGDGSPGSSGPRGSDEMGSFRYGGLASLYR